MPAASSLPRLSPKRVVARIFFFRSECTIERDNNLGSLALTDQGARSKMTQGYPHAANERISYEHPPTLRE